MKITTNPNTCLIISIFALALVSTATGRIIFVDADGIGANDGSNWADAFNYLQNALDIASSGDEICVAGGTYKPDANTANPGGTGDREATFQLISGVTIKGGYAGFSESEPNARDIAKHETILSGDIGTPEINTDNSYHVVTGADDAVLDGFTITAGNADGPWEEGLMDGAGILCYESSPKISNCLITGNSAGELGYGAGICSYYDSSPTVTNCIFKNNSTGSAGGAMFNYASDLIVTNCSFTENYSDDAGGGIHNWGWSSPTFTNCTFSGNLARVGGGMYNILTGPILTNCAFTGNSVSLKGGGMYNYQCEPTIINCTFSGNWADDSTGGIRCYDSNTTLTNCILWGNADSYGSNESSQLYIYAGTAAVNYNCIQGWMGLLNGIGNIGTDPLLIDFDGVDNIPGTLDDNLRLFVGSPCIDAGIDAGVFTDIEGNIRPVDFPGVDNNAELPDFDMGVYEATIRIEANLRIFPRVINRRSKMPKILTLLRFPEGVAGDQIGRTQPLLLYPGGIEPIQQFVTPYGRGDARRTSIFAFFDKTELMNAITDNGIVQLQVVGNLKTGQYFHGIDTVRIINRPHRPRQGRR